MAYVMSRKVKDLLIDYVWQYAKRILSSDNAVEIINSFDDEKAADAATKALMSSDRISDFEKVSIATEEGRSEIVDFFRKRLVVNFFMFSRDITYYQAKALLKDKGTDFYDETRGIINSPYPGSYADEDYKATEKQISCIKDFGVRLSHEEELSGREASNIIHCLNVPERTRPAYFKYYVDEKDFS